MAISIPAATNAIYEFMQAYGEYTEELANECDELLISLWYIDNPHIRRQIIETAAINAGLLSDVT